jgi:hypothetical protein
MQRSIMGTKPRSYSEVIVTVTLNKDAVESGVFTITAAMPALA